MDRQVSEPHAAVLRPAMFRMSWIYNCCSEGCGHRNACRSILSRVAAQLEEQNEGLSSASWLKLRTAARK